MDLFFQYELTEKPKLELELDEVNEIIWINKNDLNLNNLAFDSQKDFSGINTFSPKHMKYILLS